VVSHFVPEYNEINCFGEQTPVNPFSEALTPKEKLDWEKRYKVSGTFTLTPDRSQTSNR
jgi:hypothetical protein